MTITRLDRETLTRTEKAELPQVTLRSTIAGLIIGSVVLISNFQFGMQTGWVSMMSLPSALLGFAVFKSLQSKLSYKFTDVENVYVQSVAVATGTGPLAYGFVGILPALEKFMTTEESGILGGLDMSQFWKLIVWGLGLAFFGVYFAIPLRKQVIVKEKLPFPSGSATATLISVFHNTDLFEDAEEVVLAEEDPNRTLGSSGSNTDSTETPDDVTVVESQTLCDIDRHEHYRSNMKNLLTAFSISSTYTVFVYFIPALRMLPVFGSYLSKNYLWDFQPSPAYIGQGMIMGIYTTSYMLFGAVLGWGILSPAVKYLGWAPGSTDDWKTGSQGWILWISLAVMISDSIISFLVVTTRSIISLVKRNDEELKPEQEFRHEQTLLVPDQQNSSDEEPANATFHGELGAGSVTKKPSKVQFGDLDPRHLVSNNSAILGMIGSSVLCVVAMKMVFGAILPVYAIFSAIILALFFSILGVRALGETDLNPVSGIGKLSQLLFAVIIPRDHPGSVLINLVAGGIAEAGAQQAGDLMQDLKTGHLLGASPKAQFVAQMVGTTYSVVLSAVMYRVYNSLYEIPGKVFRVPTAVIWIDCARLVTGKGLPPHALQFAVFFGVVFAIISLLKNLVPDTNKYHRYLKFLPSGVAVGIGIYNTPSFTLARFIGGFVSYFWEKRSGGSHSAKVQMIIFSSGLVLGEGLFSVLNMLFTSLGVPHL
ncbi:unnamed protein product [Kuraishia capsulata CBS 1993]|uniref:OPT superfamily oligopeptide transporter n=1 Tax=Kuraishia capsulata CBS 1993 TaxID=1382522 RepID=W6MII8_9ASCO|nr:uncharacterized protein KUCA_T00000132001 [Kuraishia capsulata CBS 1993]CDK24172.1 unnamed protein product [Kuraishia capsulata CBS 1993]